MTPVSCTNVNNKMKMAKVHSVWVPFSNLHSNRFEFSHHVVTNCHELRSNKICIFFVKNWYKNYSYVLYLSQKFLLLFPFLFVLQIIQSRKCVPQKLLRPFFGWKGDWKCLQKKFDQPMIE